MFTDMFLQQQILESTNHLIQHVQIDSYQNMALPNKFFKTLTYSSIQDTSEFANIDFNKSINDSEWTWLDSIIQTGDQSWDPVNFVFACSTECVLSSFRKVRFYGLIFFTKLDHHCSYSPLRKK